jgi:hypothetical protein
MAKMPYRVSGTVSDTTNGKYYEFSRDRFENQPAGYVRVLATQTCTLYAQYGSTDDPLTEMGEQLTANVTMEITDPICALLVIPAASATVTVYAVDEKVGPTEIAVLKMMAKMPKGGGGMA